MFKWKRVDESEVKNKDYGMRQVRECLATARSMIGNAQDILEQMGVANDDWLLSRIASHYWDLDDTITDMKQEEL